MSDVAGNVGMPAERRALLIDRLRRDGRLLTVQLAAELGLSKDSVRRDLRTLEQEGVARRVYGGALPTELPLQGRDQDLLIDPAQAQQGIDLLALRIADLPHSASTDFERGLLVGQREALGFAIGVLRSMLPDTRPDGSGRVSSSPSTGADG